MQKQRIYSNAVYVQMQEEMESENDKQNLDELIASILTDGHIDCLERALNNVQSSSLLSSTSSSATKVVTKVVKFLMDGGANTCLTKFANRLWSRSKPRGRSSGAGGLSLSPNFQGFLKLMIPGMEKGAFLRAMSVNSSDPTAFEILAQPLLEKLGYIFIFAGDRGAWMITPDNGRHTLEKDPITGLWMISLPIEIPVDENVNQCHLEEEISATDINTIEANANEDSQSNNEVNDIATTPSRRRVRFSTSVAEEENYEHTSKSASELCIDTYALTTESSSDDPSDVQHLPADTQILQQNTDTNYTAPVLYFSSDPKDEHSFLSDTYLSAFEVDENKFISLEHFILYQKCLTVCDIECANRVLSETDHMKLCIIDQDIELSSKDSLSKWDWNTHFNAILEGLRLKFKPHSYLQEKLLRTSPRPLAKLSTEDDPSGIGLTMDNDDIDDFYEWGPNLLGIGLQIIRKELKDLSASTLRNYVQNLNSSTIDSESSRRIFELKSESESFALRTLVEKFSANAADILNGIDNDIPIENETWILWIFPTPFVGLEPEPKTYLERQMQNIFIENVPDSYFEIIKILKKRIEDTDYDIFKVVEERHLMRLRTFVKWFKNARRIQFPEALSSEEEDFRSRKTAFDSFLEVLRYSLWPTSPTHLSLRENLLRSGDFSLSRNSYTPPAFKTFFNLEESVSLNPSSQYSHVNQLKGFGKSSYLEIHCAMGHPNDETLNRTLRGSTCQIDGLKKITKNCPICHKLRVNKISRPPTRLRKNWSNPTCDVVFRDVHGPLKTARNGERYWEIFVSASCRKIWIFCIKRKDEVVQNMKSMAQIYEAKGRRIALVINDNAQEYLSKNMKDALRKFKISYQLMADYVKNGNLAEVMQRLVGSKCIANLLEGLASILEWPLAAKYGVVQLNNMVCLSAPHAILHYVTPDQLWNLPNELLSNFFSDLLEDKLNIEKLMLCVSPTDLSFFRKFWSLATVRAPTKRLGALPEDGLSLPGVHVYIGPSDDNKASFKIMELGTGKIFDSAFVILNEDAQHKKDLLTNFDRVGNQALSRPLTAQRIRDSFDTSDDLRTLEVEEESSTVSSSMPLPSETMTDDNDETAQGMNKASNGDAAYETDEDDESVTSDVENDFDLAREISAREKLVPDLPDHTRRQRQYLGDHKGVNKRSLTSSESPADTPEEELPDDESSEDSKADKEYLQRYCKANLPISYLQQNPKKAKTKSAERYQQYKRASTIAEALELGSSWSDIVWDYQRGFLRCLSSLERRRLNNLVQNCINYENQNNLPTIGSEVTVFSIDPNHPAFGKSGKLTRAAPQLTPLSDRIHVLRQDSPQMTCKWCAKDDTESTPEEEKVTRTRQYPPRQSLFQLGDQGTDHSTLAYFDFREKVIPYVPAINQLTEEFSIDSSPPTSTDATINPEDMLYVFETTTDDNKLLQFVSPLKAFTQKSDDFISRSEMVEMGTKFVQSLIKDIDDRHEWIKKREANLPTLKEYIDAISESTRYLSKTFGNSPHYVHSVTGDTVCPTDIHDAIRLDKDRWTCSMLVEMKQLITLGTWVLIPNSELKQNSNITGTTWAYRIKSDGRYKSRLCAQGFSQKFGIDYWECYSSVATVESIRVAIALAAANKRRLKTFDVKNAFQNTPLPSDEYVICRQAPGFSIHPTDDDKTLMDWYKSLGLKIPECEGPEDTLYLRLRRSMQGLKDAGRNFQKYLFAWLISEGFRQLKSDDCCWVYQDETGIDISLCVYVDDILCSSADERSEQYFEKIFYDKWEGSTGSGGLATALLGMNIHHFENGDQSCILLNNEVMIDDIAHTFGATTGRMWSTPMSERFDPSYDEDQDDLDTSKYNYRSLCGALLFVVTHTRPDCSCACSMLCSAMAKPQQKHWDAAIRLARYLFLTKTLGLCYSMVAQSEKNKIQAYVDASWAAEKGARSRAGYIIKLNGATVCYRSKLINTICLSSAESETTAAVAALKDVLWLRMHLWELGYKQPGSTPVFEDNSATISASSGNSQNKESRYYQMRTEFIRQLVRSGEVHLVYVTTKNQAADALSKNLPPTAFIRHQPTILGTQPSRTIEEDD